MAKKSSKPKQGHSKLRQCPLYAYFLQAVHLTASQWIWRKWTLSVVTIHHRLTLMVRLLDSYIWCFFKSIIQDLRFMLEIHLFITPNCHAPCRRWSKCLNLPPQYLTALKKDIHLFQVKLTCDSWDVLSFSGLKVHKNRKRGYVTMILYGLC